MLSFIFGVLLLVAGYHYYGGIIERILEPDDRETPAKKCADGVDYVVLPHWKNMLIQLLNIAGIGPVIGVILGIRFGAIVFLIIPLGNIIGGATHDFIAGMMSLRKNGANLPELIRGNLGKCYYWLFSVFMTVLLLLVVAVFINVPAQLFGGMLNDPSWFWYAVVIIFIYYIAATLFPVDKIIGKIYPLFGLMLLLGTIAIFGAIIFECDMVPDANLLSESLAFKENMWTAANNKPVIPLLFVTIACGIISGFHATQSPIIARTMETERQARSSFYGMMVVEGLIAMIWAAAGMAIYNLFPELMTANPNNVLVKITTYFLGSGWGGVTVIAVIILAVTSGDTTMRSLRLSLAEIFKLDQKSFFNRMIIVIPLIVIVVGLLLWSNKDANSFNQLWNYFSWANQVLAASTLMAATVWLMRRKKNGLVAWIPGIFMTFIVVCYILWISKEHGGPLGFGMELHDAYWTAGAITAVIAVAVWVRGLFLRRRENSIPQADGN